MRRGIGRLAAWVVAGWVQGNVVGVTGLGSVKLVTVRVGKLHIEVKVPANELVPGRQGWLIFPPERTRIYAAGEALV